MDDPSKALAEEVTFTGLRSETEILERIEGLRNEAEAGPISANELAVLEEILDLNSSAPDAHRQLRQIAEGRPALMAAVERLGQRLEAIKESGVDIEALGFEASYGRGSLEYYDGFVFGFVAGAAENQPPVASGGRYDALTRVLGQGRTAPAVGGIIRPALIAKMRAGGGGCLSSVSLRRVV